MYTEEYLARHNKHTCQDEHNYNKCSKMNYNIPSTCCPYMHMCPLMQHQNVYYGYPMMQAPKFNASIKNNLNYREEESENLFRHPYDHMSYNYDNDHKDFDDYGDYEHHYDGHDHYEDHDSNHHHSYDYYEHEPYNYEHDSYYNQAPFVQYPIFPQLPYFEEEEEEEENEHHHNNE